MVSKRADCTTMPLAARWPADVALEWMSSPRSNARSSGATRSRSKGKSWQYAETWADVSTIGAAGRGLLGCDLMVAPMMAPRCNPVQPLGHKT